MVVVANTYVRYVWAEEEKGFIRTVVGYELIDPKFIYKRIFHGVFLLLVPRDL